MRVAARVIPSDADEGFPREQDRRAYKEIRDGTMRIVCISDTHGLHARIKIPSGDILIHAGDISGRGKLEEVSAFNSWLGTLPHPHKIVIAGNHDFCFERAPEIAEPLITNARYLRDRLTEVQGLKIYGSPWQPWFWDWAFNLQRGPEIRAKWDLIPDHTDILVTHGPPAGFGGTTRSGEDVGCVDLADRVSRIKPRLHVFGHIHEAYGKYADAHTTYYNASICNYNYQPIHPPWIYDWSE